MNQKARCERAGMYGNGSAQVSFERHLRAEGEKAIGEARRRGVSSQRIEAARKLVLKAVRVNRKPVAFGGGPAEAARYLQLVEVELR